MAAKFLQDFISIVACVGRAGWGDRSGHGRPKVIGGKSSAVGHRQCADHLARGRGVWFIRNRQHDALQIALKRALDCGRQR